MPGITERTRLLTVVLSDMIDSETDAAARQEAGRAMVESLKAYHAQGGALALYYVADEYAARWRTILGLAGFEPGEYVIASDLVARPQLPSFE